MLRLDEWELKHRGEHGPHLEDVELIFSALLEEICQNRLSDDSSENQIDYRPFAVDYFSVERTDDDCWQTTLTTVLHPGPSLERSLSVIVKPTVKYEPDAEGGMFTGPTLHLGSLSGDEKIESIKLSDVSSAEKTGEIVNQPKIKTWAFNLSQQIDDKIAHLDLKRDFFGLIDNSRTEEFWETWRESLNE